MFRLAFCYIKQMKRNTLICITGIAVSIMMLFSLIQIGELILDNYRNMILAVSTYDYTISGLDKETANEIHERYQSRYGMLQAIYCAQSYENNDYVIGVKGDWNDIFRMDLLEGAAPEGRNEICVEESYARRKNLQVGDILSMPLLVGGNVELTVDFTVSGITSDAPSYSAQAYLFVSMDTAESILQDADKEQLLENPDYVEYILMNKEGFPDEEDTFEFTGYIFDTYGSDVFRNIKENERKEELGSNQDIYYYMSMAIWYIVAFIAVVMTIFIYYMMQISFQSKMDQYGTMRALGSSNAGIGRLIIGELIIYGCVGVTLGCLAGIAFNSIFAKTIIYIFVGDKITQVSVSWRMILYVLGIVAVSMTAVYLKMMLGLRKKKPIELIHNTDHVVKKKLFACKNSTVEMAVNNSFRNKRSSSALLVTMTLAFLAVLLLGNGAGSISFDLGDTMFAFADLEVTVKPGIEMALGQSQIEEDDLETLRQYADEIYCQGWEIEYHAYDDNGEPLTHVWVYSQNLMEKLIQMQHLSPENRVVASFSDGRELTGEQIILKNPDGDSIPVEIDGMADAGWANLAGQIVTTKNEIIIMGEDYARELFGREPRWMDAYISGKDLSTDELEQLLPADTYIIYDFASIMGDAVTMMQTMIILVAYMLVALMGLVVFMITSIVKQNFDHRRKEIGMMRAVGADIRSMEFMLCGEVLVLVFIAGVIASLIAAPISMYVYNVINEEAGMAVTGYLIGLPVTLLLCGIVIYGNVRKCMKQKTMELLRSE